MRFKIGDIVVDITNDYLEFIGRVVAIYDNEYEETRADIKIIHCIEDDKGRVWVDLDVDDYILLNEAKEYCLYVEGWLGGDYEV